MTIAPSEMLAGTYSIKLATTDNNEWGAYMHIRERNHMLNIFNKEMHRNKQN